MLWCHTLAICLLTSLLICAEARRFRRSSAAQPNIFDDFGDLLPRPQNPDPSPLQQQHADSDQQEAQPRPAHKRSEGSHMLQTQMDHLLQLQQVLPMVIQQVQRQVTLLQQSEKDAQKSEE